MAASLTEIEAELACGLAPLGWHVEKIKEWSHAPRVLIELVPLTHYLEGTATEEAVAARTKEIFDQVSPAGVAVDISINGTLYFKGGEKVLTLDPGNDDLFRFAMRAMRGEYGKCGTCGASFTEDDRPELLKDNDRVRQIDGEPALCHADCQWNGWCAHCNRVITVREDQTTNSGARLHSRCQADYVRARERRAEHESREERLRQAIVMACNFAETTGHHAALIVSREMVEGIAVRIATQRTGRIVSSVRSGDKAVAFDRFAGCVIVTAPAYIKRAGGYGRAFVTEYAYKDTDKDLLWDFVRTCFNLPIDGIVAV